MASETWSLESVNSSQLWLSSHSVPMVCSRNFIRVTFSHRLGGEEKALFRAIGNVNHDWSSVLTMIWMSEGREK